MTRRITLLAPVTVAVLASSSPAVAHPPPLFWMPDLSAHSSAGVDLFAGTFDFGLLDFNAQMIGGSVFANWALTDKLTLSGRVPFSYVDFEALILDIPVEGSGLALGNVGVGIQVAGQKRQGSKAAMMLGGGLHVSVPTASDDGDGGTAALLTSAFLVPDAGRFLPDTTTVRLRGDGRIEQGSVFLQGEAALDLHLIDNADDLKILVFGIGGGVTLSPYYALLVELTTVSFILEDQGGDDFVHTLDLGLRYHNPSVMVGFRVYVPLDDQFRDADMLGLGLDVGARF